jgi:serine/threonine-protein kinase
VPFDAGTFNQLMFKIVLSEVPPPETIVPDLDPAFSSIIARSMARDLQQRFQTTVEFIQALDGWMQRGAAVSVPPAADAAAAGLLPVSGRTAMGSQAHINANGPTGTSGNWASSQHDAPLVPTKKNTGLIAALAIVGLLVTGGAAFGAYALLGKKAEPTAASAAPTPSSAPAAAAVKVEEPTPAPAPERAAPIASAAPEPAAPAASVEKPAAVSPPPVARGKSAPPVAARPAAAKPTGAKPTGAKPAAGTPDLGY